MIGIEIPVHLVGGPKDGARIVTQVPLEMFVKHNGLPPTVLMVAGPEQLTYAYRLRGNGPEIVDGQPLAVYDFVKQVEGGNLGGKIEYGPSDEGPSPESAS